MRELVLNNFPLVKNTPGYEISKNFILKRYKQKNKHLMKQICFFMKDDKNPSVNFSDETMTLTNILGNL